MKKIGERITFEDQKGFTTIVIAPASVDWKNAMLFGWVIAWTYVGVYIAYTYYQKLFKKITKLPASRILSERIRIPDARKIAILTKTYFMHRLNFM